LLYGVGKFLRTSRYAGAFEPSSWRGTSVPRGTMRGIYFASHFHNWYQVAPDEQVERYVEDLALWGVNALMLCFPFINLRGWDDPEAEQAVKAVSRYGRMARELGLRFGLVRSNSLFSGAPDGARAVPVVDTMRRRGNHGHPICPSRAQGRAYILASMRELFERLRPVGLDFLTLWPYDEGGCGCDECAPWGSNGYLQFARDLTELGREYLADFQTILSTWMFDTPPEGEWAGLTGVLREADDGWPDYVMADAHEDFPRYPLDHGVPGGRPLLNFPEISMWGNWPWGGYGANPLPHRFQRLWDQVKHVVSGGFPYSEGIYEDLNKAVVTQFYWDSSRSATETLQEYIAYEFGAEDTTDVLALIDLLEMAASRSYMHEPVDVEQVRRAARIAETVHEHLPQWGRQSWRWEILRLRALLDRQRFAGDGLETTEAQAAMERLVELYYCQVETDDAYHHRVRPPLARAFSRRGDCQVCP
jgi:hypothetical protein